MTFRSWCDKCDEFHPHAPCVASPPMTAKSNSELVERLRATGGKGQCGPLKWQAADALEQMAAEIARLTGIIEFMTTANAMQAESRAALGDIPAGLDRQGPRTDAG